MEYQFRRGIYRPNAQRLSISLAPLVAQRSLLFRVKADLATKTSYGQLTPTDESDSPGLFILTASASAKIISAALTAISTSSVYSQASWKGDSPFSPAAPVLLKVDTRRHAIAFSPSVQWNAVSEELDESDRDSSVVKTPLQSAAPADVSSALAKEEPSVKTISDLVSVPLFDDDRSSPKRSVDVQLPIKLTELEGGPASKLKKKRRAEGTTKRLSRHAKAFEKVMSHLSMQPSKRDSAKAAERRQTTATIVHLAPEFKLPEFETQISPIRLSFIAKGPVFPAVPQPPPISDFSARPPAVRPRPPRSIRPPTPSRPAEYATLLLSVPPPLPQVTKKGHRRYHSSPVVPRFDFKGWNMENMPPLPSMPPSPLKMAPVPIRPRAQSVTGRAPVRAISPPFPVRERR